MPPVSQSTLIPDRVPFWRDPQKGRLWRAGLEGEGLGEGHTPQPRGGWWFSTKAVRRCFSFTPVDTGPSNGYWPFRRPRPPSSRIHGHTASPGRASAGRGGSRATKAGAAGRESSGTPWTNRATVARGSSLPVQPREDTAGARATSIRCHLYQNPLGELSVSLPPSSQPGARALGTYAGGMQGMGGITSPS